MRFTLKAGQAISISGKGIREDLQSDVALQLGVTGAIHLTHTARTNGAGDLIRPEFRARV